MDTLTLDSLLSDIDALYQPSVAHRALLATELPIQRKQGPKATDADLVGSFYRIAALLQDLSRLAAHIETGVLAEPASSEPAAATPTMAGRSRRSWMV